MLFLLLTSIALGVTDADFCNIPNTLSYCSYNDFFHEESPRTFYVARKDIENTIDTINRNGWFPDNSGNLSYEFFGSAVTGIILSDSDIDVAIHSHNIEKPLHHMKCFIQSNLDYVFEITDSTQMENKLALLKLKHKPSGVNIDVKVHDPREIDLSVPIRDVLDRNALWVLREFLIEVKKFSRNLPISHGRLELPCISAFAMTLLGIHYWQEIRIDPKRSKNLSFAVWVLQLIKEPVHIEMASGFKFKINRSPHDKEYMFTRYGSDNNMFSRMKFVKTDELRSYIIRYANKTMDLYVAIWKFYHAGPTRVDLERGYALIYPDNIVTKYPDKYYIKLTETYFQIIL